MNIVSVESNFPIKRLVLMNGNHATYQIVSRVA